MTGLQHSLYFRTTPTKDTREVNRQLKNPDLSKEHWGKHSSRSASPPAVKQENI